MKAFRCLCIGLCIILLSISAYAQNDTIFLEQGGISTAGELGNNKTRVRTCLLPHQGRIKVNPRYMVMNCMGFDDNGKFVEMVPIHHRADGYIGWDSQWNVRLSFCVKADREALVTKEEYVIEDYIANSLLSTSIQSHFLSPNWVAACNQTMSDDFCATPVFRIPVIVVFTNGDVYIGCEGQYSESKHAFYVQSVSKDGGKIFKAKKSSIPLSELVYDEKHDRLFSLTTSVCYASDDHGDSWYKYSYLNLKVKEDFNHNLTSPTTGIQLKNGILVVPMRSVLKKRNADGTTSQELAKTVNFVIYSRDYGKTWEQSPFTPEELIADEVTIVEYKPNQIMLNARGGTEYYWDATANGRRVFVSSKKSKSSVAKWNIACWITEKKSDGKIWDPICNASLAKVSIQGKIIGLFCNPYTPEEYTPRRNLGLIATKDFKHWKQVGILTPKDERVFGYSAIAYRNGHIYFCYEDCKKGILFADITYLEKDILESLYTK